MSKLENAEVYPDKPNLAEMTPFVKSALIITYEEALAWEVMES